jgi:S-(hydroxymethyl)glutathione synthase
MYGRIENKNHPMYGFDFIHTELSSQQGWSPRGIRVRSSPRLSSRAPIRRTWALSDRLRELSLEPMIAYRRG